MNPIIPKYNFASWYSLNKRKEEMRPWIINQKEYPPVPIGLDVFDLVIDKLSFETMTQRFVISKDIEIRNYLYPGEFGLLITATYVLNIGSIEIASYDVASIFDIARKIGLPTKQLEKILGV